MTQTNIFTPVNLFITTLCFLTKRASCNKSTPDSSYVDCRRPRNCSDGQDIHFPFFFQSPTPQNYICGYPGFNLSCNSKGNPYLRIANNDYTVRQIFYPNQTLRVSNAAVFDTNTTCIPPISNVSLLDGRFRLSNSNRPDLFLLYNCNTSLMKYKVDCFGGSERNLTLAIMEDDPLFGYAVGKCRNGIAAPVVADGGGVVDVVRMLERGFMMNWTASNCSICEASGGRCGFNVTTYHFRCFCPDRPHAWHCIDDPAGNQSLGSKIGLGLGLGGGLLVVIAVAMMSLYFTRRHYKQRQDSSNLLQREYTSSRNDLEDGSVCFGISIFTYKELETATNNFDSKKELGDGGFGAVYYGKLRDGREVAVKRLYQNNYRRLEQFMNEVKILTRIRHKNLVSLYGCTSRHSRELLLVYEFIRNGTVADHLHGDRSNSKQLTWPVRMRIAIETANALAYLHASDIVHRDVKTTNILLDSNFSVKVADFGLSRLFPTDVTHVSTAPQGTPGYVDPEYHQCYQLTDKSDVYSFGVVLIELISSMPAVDITRDRSEINLTNLAINKIENSAIDELIDLSLGYQTDTEVRRMTTCIAGLAFQCIQQVKETRPTMLEVLEELTRIETGESKEKHEDVIDDKLVVIDNTVPPASPATCEDSVLLKHVRMLPSPDSVTNRWVSSDSVTPTVSGLD